MDRARLNMEQQILNKYFSKRHGFVGIGSSDAYVDLGLKSNSGKVYRFRIMLSQFPQAVPKVFLIFPKGIPDKNGNTLSSLGWSHEMHLLTPMDGNPQICHYKSENWSELVTIYKIGVKLRIWMEAYEGHLRTGRDLDYFVNS